MRKNYHLLGAVLLAALLSACSVTVSEEPVALSSAVRGPMHTDNVAPSVNPPAGLRPAETPQFICIGFDDNAYLDSLEWIRDFMASKKNFIEGAGNPVTYDGDQATATFFMTGQYLTSDGHISSGGSTIPKMAAVLTDLYNQGHEIGNHTYQHTADKSIAELTLCNDTLVNLGIVPRNEIFGFRAPNLSYDDATISNLYQMGFLYDCTIEEIWDSNKTGKDDYWPFTLDNGSPYMPIPAISNYPGMWEIPVYTVQVAGQNRIEAAFDYNLWATRGLNQAQFVETLKNALDARLAGNRAPFAIGGHTDEYSMYNYGFETNHTPNSTWQQRRAAIEEFLIYAMNKPQVRVVSYKKVIDWMRNPQPLTGSAVVEPEPEPNPDPTVPMWDSTAVYNKGDEVNYDNIIWVAQWWTQGDIPGSLDARGAWVKR